MNRVRDVIEVVLELLKTAKHEIVFFAPPSFLSISASYGTVESAKQFVQRGGTLKGITTISRANVEEMQVRLDAGEDLRHSDTPHRLFLFVADGKQSISSTNTDIGEFTLATPVNAFWNQDPAYAEFLLAAFERAWSQAVPAEERIKEFSDH